MLRTNDSATRSALSGLALLAAVLVAPVQPAGAEHLYYYWPPDTGVSDRLVAYTLPFASPDLTVDVAAPAELQYGYGGLFTITIGNPLTIVNGAEAGSTASGVNALVLFSGLQVVSGDPAVPADADSGFVCLPVYPRGSFQQLAALHCHSGTIHPGGQATINVTATYLGVDDAPDANCWPAYTDARVSFADPKAVERDLTNNQAIASTGGCRQGG